MQKRPGPEKIKGLLGPLLTRNRRSKITEVLSRRTRYITLVLDDLYHQHNMSAVARSCEAFGIQDLHVIEVENRFSPSHGVAMGAQQWISIIRHHSVKACINTLKRSGYRILAADPPERAAETKGKSVFRLEEIDLEDGPVAIALGKELDGLDPELRKGCDGVTYIPLMGFTESLNVSVTAALFLFELRRKLERLPRNTWSLEAKEMERLEALWYVRSLKRGEKILEDLLKREQAAKQKKKGAM